MNPFTHSIRFAAAGRLIRPTFLRYRWRLAAGFASLVGVNMLQLFIPRLSKTAIDQLDKGIATHQGLLKLCLIIIMLAIGTGICRFGWRYLVLGFSRIMERDLRCRMFSHLLTLDRTYYLKNPTGQIMALATNDINAVQLAGGMGLIAFADALFMTTATLAFMSFIHPGLTLLAILPMPLLVVLTSWLSGKLHLRFKRVQEEFGQLTEFARTTIATIRLVKAHTQEVSQTRRFDQLGRGYISDSMKLATIHGVLWPVSGLIASFSLFLVLWFGGRLTIEGTITIGDFVAFTSYLFMLSWPMMALGWVVNLFQRGATSLERLEAVFAARPQISIPEHPLAAPSPPKELHLRGLSFSYPGEQKQTLHDITLTLPVGLTGLAGATGSGKSTVCLILARLFPVSDGAFFLDETDCNRLSPASVHEHIAYVPQETILFAETISANIALGRPEARPEEIEQVARLAAIHDEISRMPGGYQAKIGERGVQLSGGQRQRLALARALLLDRPILIIDDGLSAVDTDTEQIIIANLLPLLTNRICLFVSHRIAPLVHARQIYILEAGRITDSGSHQDLSKRNMYYRQITEHQTGNRRENG